MGSALLGALRRPDRRRLQQTRAAEKRRDLAYVFWSFAKFQKADASQLEALSRDVMDKAAEFEPKELANRAWAVTKLLLRETALLGVIGRET